MHDLNPEADTSLVILPISLSGAHFTLNKKIKKETSNILYNQHSLPGQMTPQQSWFFFQLHPTYRWTLFPTAVSCRAGEHRQQTCQEKHIQSLPKVSLQPLTLSAGDWSIQPVCSSHASVSASVPALWRHNCSKSLTYCRSETPVIWKVNNIENIQCTFPIFTSFYKEPES